MAQHHRDLCGRPEIPRAKKPRRSSAGVLKYRVPKNRAGALEDARRAVRMGRENSKARNISKIGMLGFSAGGHLTAACSNSPDHPNFSVLVYPAYLFKEGGHGYGLRDTGHPVSNWPSLCEAWLRESGILIP